MDISNIPLLNMLRSQAKYQSERQRLIAQNVANADTPNFMPSDLAPLTVKGNGQSSSTTLGMSLTQPGHIQRTAQAGSDSGFKVKQEAKTEATLGGNGVDLEDQMMKMSEARMNYDAAISFYQKSMNLLKMAARTPGR